MSQTCRALENAAAKVISTQTPAPVDISDSSQNEDKVESDSEDDSSKSVESDSEDDDVVVKRKRKVSETSDDGDSELVVKKSRKHKKTLRRKKPRRVKHKVKTDPQPPLSYNLLRTLQRRAARIPTRFTPQPPNPYKSSVSLFSQF